jgi:hypothetical protein
VFDFDFERKREMGVLKRVLVFGVVITMVMVMRVASHDYGDALTKSILFFEGQRSGKLPPTQRMTWRKDSGLQDGFQIGVSLVLCVCVCVCKCFFIDIPFHFYFCYHCYCHCHCIVLGHSCSEKKPTSVFKNRHLQYVNYPPVVSGQLVGASPFGRPLTSLGSARAQPGTRD